jgi:hypothetical protein
VSDRRPDFDDLAGGDDLAPDEEARLRRMHELLVAAGPPPELPPALADPPAERPARVVQLPGRRRRGVVLLVAAAVAAAAFGGGYWLGDRNGGWTTEGHPIAMHGSSAGELASIRLAPGDRAGNWPLLLRVRGLPQLPKGGYYELLLTKDGRVGPTCGTFRVHGGITEVELNAPYDLRRWSGWIVVAHRPGQATSAPVLKT